MSTHKLQIISQKSEVRSQKKNKNILYFVFVCFLFSVVCRLVFAQDKLLLDGFEGTISGGPSGTVDYGSGNGSSVYVTAAGDIKQAGSQSLKIVYDAVSGGYIWVARGTGLDAQNAWWLVKPQDIDWNKYNRISFYMYGSGSKTRAAFDIKDNGGELWRFIVTEDWTDWKKIDLPFAVFSVRDDWQPDSADKNGVLDFPLKSYQIEPLPEAKGVFYVDEVMLGRE